MSRVYSNPRDALSAAIRWIEDNTEVLVEGGVTLQSIGVQQASGGWELHAVVLPPPTIQCVSVDLKVGPPNAPPSDSVVTVKQSATFDYLAYERYLNELIDQAFNIRFRQR